jgi:hypothetical protein
MKCPQCGAETRVSDSRAVDDGRAVRRRRVCDECAHRVTTYETIPNPYDASERIAGLDIAIHALHGVREEVKRREQAMSGGSRGAVLAPRTSR